MSGKCHPRHHVLQWWSVAAFLLLQGAWLVMAKLVMRYFPGGVVVYCLGMYAVCPAGCPSFRRRCSRVVAHRALLVKSVGWAWFTFWSGFWRSVPHPSALENVSLVACMNT